MHVLTVNFEQEISVQDVPPLILARGNAAADFSRIRNADLLIIEEMSAAGMPCPETSATRMPRLASQDTGQVTGIDRNCRMDIRIDSGILTSGGVALGRSSPRNAPRPAR